MFKTTTLTLLAATAMVANAQLPTGGFNFFNPTAVRAAIPECQGLCTFTTCIGGTPGTTGFVRPEASVLQKCLADCKAKSDACDVKAREAYAAQIAAQQKAQQDALEMARQRLLGSGTGGQTGGAPTTTRPTPEELKKRCEEFCDRIFVVATAADKNTACKTRCGDAQGFLGCLPFVQQSLREKLGQAGTTPNDVAQKLQDVLATQRALFDDRRAQLAAKIEEGRDAIKQAEADRTAKFQAGLDAIAQFRKDLQAAKTPEERKAVIEAARKELQDKIDAAKAAAEARRKELGADAQALVDKAKAERANLAERLKTLVIKISALKPNAKLQDLLDKLRAAIDAKALGKETTTMKKKRNTGCVAVVNVSPDDVSADEAVSNIVSEFVETEMAVTIITAEQDAAPDTPTELNGVAVETTVEPVRRETNPANGAASLMLGVAAIVCSALTMF